MFAHQKKVLLSFALLFFTVSVACSTSSLPFIGGEPEAEIAPTVNPADLEIMIAEAATTKVAQTLEAIPTNTATSIPTETAVPSPTAIPPTSTPTEVDYPNTGSALEENDDGLTVYTDYTGAYSLSVPAHWLALRPGEEEFVNAFLLPEAAAPEIQKSLGAIQSFDPNTYRLIILDAQDGHYSSGFVTNINVVLGDNGGASLEEVFAANVLGMPDNLPGAVITSSNISETSSGEKVGFIIFEQDAATDAGAIIRIYQKIAIFVIENHSVVISYASPVDFKDQIIEDFDMMVDGFGLLD
ncbi:MAG: hypothetical protein HOG15_07835 [Anaerolineae bacterium]|jgi:hypothetical protein|nr:hypothetical protein [Anaerolineae bacterium]